MENHEQNPTVVVKMDKPTALAALTNAVVSSLIVDIEKGGKIPKTCLMTNEIKAAIQDAVGASATPEDIKQAYAHGFQTAQIFVTCKPRRQRQTTTAEKPKKKSAAKKAPANGRKKKRGPGRPKGSKNKR